MERENAWFFNLIPRETGYVTQHWLRYSVSNSDTTISGLDIYVKGLFDASNPEGKFAAPRRGSLY